MKNGSLKEQEKTSQWLKKVRLKTNKGKPIEFDNHAFLRAFLEDNARRIVVQKCTQIGASFTALIKLLHRGDRNNLSIIYTLPTSGDIKDFVRSKFDPVVLSSATLKKKIEKDEFTHRTVYSTILKRIGKSHYFFRGSWSEHSAQAIDADILCVDELDFQKAEIREMYEERLSGSDSQDTIYWMGVPTLPNFGISEIYEISDQRKWWIECPKCFKKQTLEFPENISFKKKTYVCKFCRADLSDDDRKKGEWIAGFPKREIHGYYFNRLMAPWIPAVKVIDQFQKKKSKHFNNFTLGLPFLEKFQQLQKEEYQDTYVKSYDLQIMKGELKVFGIDQGNHFHLIKGRSNKEKAVVTGAGICLNAEELEEELDKSKPDLVAMDMYPDQHYAKKLQKKYGVSKFILVNQRTWAESRKAKSFMEYDRINGRVNLERTEALDRLYERIRSGGLGFLETMDKLEEIYEHLKNLIPETQERLGNRKKIYQKIGKEDFAHATNYFLTASELLFPELDDTKTKIVPAVMSEDFVKGSKDWIKDDFEKTIRRVSNPEDIIVIPPKRL